MPRDGSSTRDAILATAMARFVEHGYDKTSLREIADDVGVTKAALYYHFRTKDDIVAAALDAYGAQLGAIVDWVEQQPPGPDRDAGLADRMLTFVEGEGRLASRFMQRNPTVVGRGSHTELHLGFLTRLLAALTGPDPSAEASIRAMLAYAALAVSGIVDEAPIPLAGTPDERRTAARSVALELLGSLPR